MKDDIHILGDRFKQEISSCKSEEDCLRKIRAKYEKMFSALQSNNEKRIKAIQEIRLNKIKEIDDEYEKSKLELKKLQDEADSILFAYCSKKGHNDILISSETLGSTGVHSFSYGFERIVRAVYKCAVCGRVWRYNGTGYGHYSVQAYEQKIPEDIYDDKSLTEDGKTFRMVQEEISKITQYINYLNSLYLKLCELFGHDAEIIDGRENFKCKCCGKTISYREYVDTYHKAKYRGIVDFYYDNYPDKGYITSSAGKLDLSLPTFENYQKTIELKQKQAEAQAAKEDSKKLTKKRETHDCW